MVVGAGQCSEMTGERREGCGSGLACSPPKRKQPISSLVAVICMADTGERRVTVWRLLRDGDLTLGEVLREWAITLRCRFIGHRWERQSTYYPGAGEHYEGEMCVRCWVWEP